ncbi:hypothetical protein SCOCK_580017 [Actinacidiphila cocklensis]|uniref:Uncharacterized protein n=1 Tax=Actinacidiphila cocklensis TaxID=887465 RepID=A0A9W4DY80_9ACTN|nr:hypothetical protein SCOCK_580017 [Actinacidiphila cocklensis]
MVACGVSSPGPSGFGDQPSGGLDVIAEGLRDDRGQGLEDKLTDGGPAVLWRDTDLAQVGLQADRAHRLP